LVIKKPRNANVIDNLSEGFASLNRRIWLVLAPVALNLYLWYGVQLSFGPLFRDLAATLSRLPATQAEPGDFRLLPEQLLALGRMDMRRPLAVLNTIPTLTLYVVGNDGAFDSLPLVQALPQMVDEQRNTPIQVGGFWGAVLAFLILNLLALPLSAAFLTALAEAVRGDRAPLPIWLRRTWRAAAALLGCFAAIVGVGLAIGLPFLFFTSLLLLLSPVLGGLAASLLFVVWFWVQIYIGFAQEAIVVSRIGPLQAIRASFNIVRRNFWSTLALLGLSFLVIAGTGLIWQTMVGTSAGVLAAIVGSAYIGSGLLAARMAFYRERLRRWQAAPAVRPIA
jgi:hypothetical protein